MSSPRELRLNVSMPLLSELEYAAFLSYVPRPATDAGKASKQWMYHLKNDHLFGHPPKSMSTLVAQRLAETLVTLPFRDLLDGTALAVPVPKSSLMRPGSLWVPLLLCKALKEAGLVAEVLDCLRRQHAVRKSATSAPSERATARIHYESMSVEKALVPPTASLLLVDDVISHGYLAHDPVRRELEIRLKRGEMLGAFVWDQYDRELAAIEEEIITRRRAHGLRQGFSAYCESSRHDVLFLVSFATAKDAPPSDRALMVGRTVVPHLNRCRKRLDLSARVAQLSEKERIVAEWLVAEKNNGEIARILGISEATAKFHVANILKKLETKNRLGAAAVLIAERCLA